MAEEYDRGIEFQSDAQTGMSGAREKARATSRDMLDRAVEKKDELKHRATTLADDRREGVAERAGSVSRALHGAADALRDNGEPQLSGWVHQAAGQVERVVDYLHGKRADGMANDLENLARQNPALFLGGTYLAGLAFGRFLRASSPERRTPDENLDALTESGGTTGWTGVGLAPAAVGDPARERETSSSAPGGSESGMGEDVAWGGGSDRDTDVFGSPRVDSDRPNSAGDFRAMDAGTSAFGQRGGSVDPEQMRGSGRESQSNTSVDPESMSGSTRDVDLSSGRNRGREG